MGYGNGGTTLTFVDGAQCTPIHNSRDQVDPAAIRVWHPSEAQYRIVSSSRVESDQDEPSEVTIDLCPMPHSAPVPAKCSSKQSCSFTAVQVPLPRARLRGK